MPTEVPDPYIGPDGQVRNDRTRTVSDQEINDRAIRDALLAAMETNRADIVQAQNILDRALIPAGNRTAAQLSNDVRLLETGVRLMAQHSLAQARQLNGLARLLLGQVDGTD